MGVTERLRFAVALLTTLLSVPGGFGFLCAQESGQVTFEVPRETASPNPLGSDCQCDEGCGPCREIEIISDMTLRGGAGNSGPIAGQSPLIAVVGLPLATSLWAPSHGFRKSVVEPPGSHLERRSSILLI